LEPFITPLVTIVVPILKVIAGLVKLILWPFKSLVEVIKIGATAVKGFFGPMAADIGKMVSALIDATPLLRSIVDWIKDISANFAKLKDGEMSIGKGIGAGLGLIGLYFFGKAGLRGLMSLISKPFSMLASAGKGLLSKIPGIGGMFGPKDAAKIGDVADKAKGVSGSSGESIKKFLSGLATGLKEMGAVGIAKGAWNLFLSIPGMLAALPMAIGGAALGLAAPLVLAGLTALSQGLKLMGDKAVFKGALGMLAVAGSLVVFAYGLKMFGDVKWESVYEGLSVFALLTLVTAGLGLIAPAMLAGAASIAAMGLALIPLGFGAEYATAGLKMFGGATDLFVAQLERLATIDLTKAAFGISAISLALAGFGGGAAAAGLGSLIGGLLGGDPIKKLEKLASLGDKLKLSSESITAISQSLSAFGAVTQFSSAVDVLSVSLEKLNEQLDKLSLLKLAALTAASAVSSIAGTPSAASGGGGMAGVEARLDKLTDLLLGGAIGVYMDGKKMSSAIATMGT